MSIVRTGGAAFAAAAIVIALCAGKVQAEDFVTLKNFDLPGNDLRSPMQDPSLKKISLGGCQAACLADKKCSAFTYNEAAGWCFLKTGMSKPVSFGGAVSGVRANKQSAAARARAVPSAAVPSAKPKDPATQQPAQQVVQTDVLKPTQSGPGDLHGVVSEPWRKRVKSPSAQSGDGANPFFGAAGQDNTASAGDRPVPLPLPKAVAMGNPLPKRKPLSTDTVEQKKPVAVVKKPAAAPEKTDLAAPKKVEKAAGVKIPEPPAAPVRQMTVAKTPAPVAPNPASAKVAKTVPPVPAGAAKPIPVRKANVGSGFVKKIDAPVKKPVQAVKKQTLPEPPSKTPLPEPPKMVQQEKTPVPDMAKQNPVPRAAEKEAPGNSPQRFAAMESIIPIPPSAAVKSPQMPEPVKAPKAVEAPVRIPQPPAAQAKTAPVAVPQPIAVPEEKKTPAVLPSPPAAQTKTARKPVQGAVSGQASTVVLPLAQGQRVAAPPAQQKERLVRLVPPKSEEPLLKTDKDAKELHAVLLKRIEVQEKARKLSEKYLKRYDTEKAGTKWVKISSLGMTVPMSLSTAQAKAVILSKMRKDDTLNDLQKQLALIDKKAEGPFKRVAGKLAPNVASGLTQLYQSKLQAGLAFRTARDKLRAFGGQLSQRVNETWQMPSEANLKTLQALAADMRKKRGEALAKADDFVAGLKKALESPTETKIF